MTDELSSPPGGPGGRRKRPPTVLDLEATDVTPATEAAAPETAPAPGTPAPASDASPETAAEPAAPSPEQSAEQPERPHEQAEPPPGPPPSAGRMPEGMAWTQIGAGIAGATGGLLLFLLLWLGGALPGIRDTSADIGPQLAAIQKQLTELSQRPAPATIDPKALDAIAARLAKLEAAQGAPRAPATDPTLGGRLNAIENALKSLSGAIAALSQRADGQDGAIREANARLEKLDAALGELQAAINTRIEKSNAALADLQTAMRTAQAGSDRAGRLAVAATALRGAVERGEPFAAELAIVKPLAPDSSAIAVIEPFAAAGLPSDAALGQELAAAIRAMPRKPSAPPAGAGSFLDRLQANAEKLVRVTPVGDARGGDQDAMLSKIEQQAAQGNVAAAVSEIGKLPADAREPFQTWIAKVQARSKAIEASRSLASEAIAALKPAP